MTAKPVAQEAKLHKGTNWWGAFVIGLAGPILVTNGDRSGSQD